MAEKNGNLDHFAAEEGYLNTYRACLRFYETHCARCTQCTECSYLVQYAQALRCDKHYRILANADFLRDYFAQRPPCFKELPATPE